MSLEIQNKFRQTNLMHSKSCPYYYFHFFDHPTWEERLKLREILLNHLEKLIHLGKDKEKLLIPGRRPWISLASISISHCKILGGFIFSLDTNTSIGLDIEEIVRIRPGLTDRLSQKKEVEQAPTDALLWVAKEASFKCLPPNNKSIFMSHIYIFNWSHLHSEAYSFCFQVKDYTGNGIAFIEKDLAVANAQITFHKDS